ncbi:hypothetical protein [Burkholderia multivorans]|uniref:hypothetical protein n=1 Tax=Burkholderia multivorans TaxID=87883 RepID=UPI0011311C3C|nr:hypothetical protein [Burkholderia multivorans]
MAEFCARHLAPIGLTVPPVELASKSAICEPDEAAEFLGVSLVRYTARYRLELTQEQIDVIRDDLLKLGSVQELVTRALPKLGHVLMLRRNGYLAAYDMCHDVENLSREWGSWNNEYFEESTVKVLGLTSKNCHQQPLIFKFDLIWLRTPVPCKGALIRLK